MASPTSFLSFLAFLKQNVFPLETSLEAVFFFFETFWWSLVIISRYGYEVWSHMALVFAAIFWQNISLQNVFDIQRERHVVVDELFRYIWILNENQVNGQDERHFERPQGGPLHVARLTDYHTASLAGLKKLH